jgi:hypothetical protein
MMLAYHHGAWPELRQMIERASAAGIAIHQRTSEAHRLLMLVLSGVAPRGRRGGVPRRAVPAAVALLWTDS